MVAFSVPIWDSAEENREVIGVLGMTVELGGFHFDELELDDNQMVVLVDTIADREGKGGLVLQHAELAKQRLNQENDASVTVPTFYISEDQLARLQELRQEILERSRARDRLSPEEQLTEREPPSELGLERDYRDPVDREYRGRWLAAFEPVLVKTRTGCISDTGWVVIGQERNPER